MAVQQSVGQVQIALWEQRARTLDSSDFHLRRPTDRLVDEFARRVGLETDITALTTERSDGKYIFDEAKVDPKVQHLRNRGVSPHEWAYLAAACGHAQMPISVARWDDVMADTWNPEPGQCAFFNDDPRGMAGEWKEMVGRWNAFAEELWEDDDMLSSKTMIYDRMILVTERGQLDTKEMSDVFLIGNGGGGSGEKAVCLSGTSLSDNGQLPTPGLP
ncbi:hypothetical protein DL771_010616 [Monosporascus sp. 5C6A]|nr:hypothetical protein DL771_010616 [Monosporascus sp. 5C6A]